MIFSFRSANVTPYSGTVKGCASPDPEKSCARELVRFFQLVPLTVLRIPLWGRQGKEKKMCVLQPVTVVCIPMRYVYI